MERMYSDLERVIRYVKPKPVGETAIGNATLSHDLSEGAWKVLADPWDEEEIQKAAGQAYDLKPNRERV
eukprot:2703104-Lingulodinium_polyedra.AAC.1